MPKQNTSRNFVVIAVTAVVATAVVQFIRLRSRDVTLASQNVLLGYIHNNPDEVFAYRSSGDVEYGKLTLEQFRRAWGHIAAPLLREAKYSEKTVSETLNDPPTQAVASISILLDDGVEFELGASCWVTEEGPKSPVLYDMLNTMWLLREAKANPKAYASKQLSFFDAKVKGLNQDRQFLESIGLRGAFSGGGRYMTWDQLLAHNQKFRGGERAR